MKEYLFSYGTLQKEKVQLDLFGRIFKGVADVLSGYKVVPIEIKDESFLSKGEAKLQLTAIVSKDKNDCIKGTAFEVTEEEVSLADNYEPDSYKRVKVLLASGKEAWLYLAIE